MEIMSPGCALMEMALKLSEETVGRYIGSCERERSYKNEQSW